MAETVHSPSAGARPELPPGFSAAEVITNLNRPTAIRFGPTGRAWVAEQEGMLKVFEQLSDGQPVLTADLSERVFGRNNRGLLGLAPDPSDPAVAYVLYTFPAPPGVDRPVWDDGATNCPDGTTRSCVSTGVLARVAFGADGVATDTVLVRGWCHHHASHVPNDLQFGPDGGLYASAGEGSVPELPLDDGSWLPAELRCNAGAFAALVAPAERDAGEWNGAIVRFAAADLAATASGAESPEWLAGRATLVAYGLRNPFRMSFRPRTAELWIGDPGWERFEEIDVVTDATDTAVEDFGWPCREGHEPTPQYADDPRCASLAANPALAVEPWFVERDGFPVGAADHCPVTPSAISAVNFGPLGWPGEYGQALFYADFVRGCLYIAPVGTDDRPDPAGVRAFWSTGGAPVDLTSGPDGALYVALIDKGVIVRLTAP